MQSILFVLSQFPPDCHPEQIQPLGSAGGFSGATFWKIMSRRGPLCLRRWPKEHPSQNRIDFIHRLLQHVVNEGFDLVPLPISLHSDPTRTYFRHQEHFWELVPWLPGATDCRLTQSKKKMKSAMHVLANFHRAASNFIDPAPISDRSVTVRERLEQIDLWIQSDLARLESQAGYSQCATIDRLSQWKSQIIDYAKHHIHRVRHSLHAVINCRVTIQACIRDVWHQHILFLGDHVSGVVDFGAARADTVVTDLTRLLGSIAGNDKIRWEYGLNAYESIRPLSDQERLLVHPLDQTAILLAGLNWMRWLYLENRVFSDESAVEARLENVIARLETAETKIN